MDNLLESFWLSKEKPKFEPNCNYYYLFEKVFLIFHNFLNFLYLELKMLSKMDILKYFYIQYLVKYFNLL